MWRNERLKICLNSRKEKCNATLLLQIENCNFCTLSQWKTKTLNRIFHHNFEAIFFYLAPPNSTLPIPLAFPLFPEYRSINRYNTTSVLFRRNFRWALRWIFTTSKPPLTMHSGQLQLGYLAERRILLSGNSESLPLGKMVIHRKP